MIGPDVVIEDGVCLSHCTVLKGTRIKSHAWIKQAIIGWKCTIGRWVRCKCNEMDSGVDMTMKR